jgi:hypothetical protein
MQEEEETPYE